MSRHGPHLAVGVGSVRSEIFVGDLRGHVPRGAAVSSSLKSTLVRGSGRRCDGGRVRRRQRVSRTWTYIPGVVVGMGAELVGTVGGADDQATGGQASAGAARLRRPTPDRK
jgi:hypothetical protein